MTTKKYSMNPISRELGGGYFARFIKTEATRDSESIVKQTIRDLGITVSPRLLDLFINQTFDSILSAVAEDGIPRQWGKIMRIAPTLKGRYRSKLDEVPLEAVQVNLTPLKGFIIDKSEWTLVNTTAGAKLYIERIYSEGLQSSGVIGKNLPIAVGGTNLKFLEGDSASIEWVVDDEPVSISITPTSSDYGHMRFAWPEALNDVEAGTELTFRFKTRAGVPTGPQQEASRTVTLVNA